MSHTKKKREYKVRWVTFTSDVCRVRKTSITGFLALTLRLINRDQMESVGVLRLWDRRLLGGQVVPFPPSYSGVMQPYHCPLTLNLTLKP